MRIGVGLTGASGLQYGFRLIDTLLNNAHEVHVFATRGATQVAHMEMGVTLKSASPHDAWEGHPQASRLQGVAENNCGGINASGSSAVDAMVVMPCSMKTLAHLAHGTGGRSLDRCAEVMLKEARPLIVVPRETPMSLIDLKNQVSLKEAGAHIVPACPGFYTQPQTVDDMVDFMVQKVVSLLGLEISLTAPWRG